MAELEIVFLGTGGGRFVTLTQRRRTAGIRFVWSGWDIHLDPGPGALIFSVWRRLPPSRVYAVLVSHAHPDHYNDAELLIEAMTRGMTRRRGALIASRSVLQGNEVCGPVVSRYHQSMPELVRALSPGQSVEWGGVTVKATRAVHSDPDTVGFRLWFPGVGEVGYTSDTEYFEGCGRQYRGVRILILCTMRPRGQPWKGHMSTDDAVAILGEAEPEMAVMTHFGMKMLNAGPEREAEEIKRQTGVDTVAAVDDMRLRVGEELQVVMPGRRR